MIRRTDAIIEKYSSIDEIKNLQSFLERDVFFSCHIHKAISEDSAFQETCVICRHDTSVKKSDIILHGRIRYRVQVISDG